MSEYRWLTEISQEFLQRDYLTPGQTVDERVDIICNAAENILKKPGFAKEFKENFKKGWYSFSTPIWTNFGNNRGLPISCFGSHISDNCESIASTWAEVFMMTKHGGGTSAYFGDLRSRGSKIKDNGESSGSVHFMQSFDNLINVVSQGKTRRGNFAAYLPIDHPDILEFLQIRSEGAPIQDLSYGVCIPDYWMNEMIGDGSSEGGCPEKRTIWAKVLEARSSLGFPYIVFIDTVNNNTVDCYKENGNLIKHSNLCVIGNQRVVSNRGIKTAKQLYEEGGELKLWDNTKIVNSSPMQLIEKNADVYKITLDNGMTHTVTKYHKILTSKYNSYQKEENEIKSCEELQIGDRVAIQTNKGLFGNINRPKEAFLLGLYQADGTQTNKEICLDVWEKDFDLLQEFQEDFNYIHHEYNCDKYLINSQNCILERSREPAIFHDCQVIDSKIDKKRLSSKTLKKCLNFEKGYVPDWIFESNEETQWQYVRGLLYADGTVFISKSKVNPLQVNLASIDKEFLQQVQLIFANLGLQSYIRLLREAGQTLLPDGKGGEKYYKTQDCWRLIVGNKNDALNLEKNTGFLSRKGFEIEDREYCDNTKKYYDIISIEYAGKEDVYCCKVDSEEHLWTCNGFITHNCSEIMLPNGEDESFVCDLSSMNILHYDEWKDTNAVELLAYFLDAVMTEFIEKAKNIQFMHKTVKFAERHRALGIGWLGWHSYLQSKMIPWESMEAKLENVKIAKNIKKAAYAASAKMAEEYGEPEACKGFGRRNTTLMAIAPTKSSAFILGQVSEGIEPHRTNYYIKDLQKGKYTVKNPQLESCLESKGKNTEEVWDFILKNGGSVQKLSFLTENEKMVFKTFAEISPKEIIIQAAQRQKYIDQSQSLNLMIHPSVPVKDVNALMIEAWKQGVKSLYYQISVNAAQAFSRSILECASCQ
jgi:ribonucleoside-diphosphate reductase alpha chain